MLIFVVFTYYGYYFLLISSEEINQYYKMSDLSDFERGQIVGARMASACVIKTAKLFCVVRSSISKGVLSRKPPHRSKTRVENESCLIGTVGHLPDY